MSQMVGKATSAITNIQFCGITYMLTNTETGVPRCSVKMVFLTISQNSQESIYVGVSYQKSSRLLDY